VLLSSPRPGASAAPFARVCLARSSVRPSLAPPASTPSLVTPCHDLHGSFDDRDDYDEQRP